MASGSAQAPVPGMRRSIGTPCSASWSSRRHFSSSPSEFASELAPNTASPTPRASSQRQCRSSRGTLGERSRANGVSTGASTPRKRAPAASGGGLADGDTVGRTASTPGPSAQGLPTSMPRHRLLVEVETQTRGLMQQHTTVAVLQLPIDQASEVEHLVVPEELDVAGAGTPGKSPSIAPPPRRNPARAVPAPGAAPRRPRGTTRRPHCPRSRNQGPPPPPGNAP
jgi:hypothetical protein